MRLLNARDTNCKLDVDAVPVPYRIVPYALPARAASDLATLRNSLRRAPSSLSPTQRVPQEHAACDVAGTNEQLQRPRAVHCPGGPRFGTLLSCSRAGEHAKDAIGAAQPACKGPAVWSVGLVSRSLPLMAPRAPSRRVLTICTVRRGLVSCRVVSPSPFQPRGT